MVTTPSTGHPQRAGSGDLEGVLSLLKAANLPTEGVREHFHNFFIIREAGLIVGAIGFEDYQEDALLRSLVVAPAARGRGLGLGLIDHALRAARARGVRTVYGLTESIEGLLARLAFRRCDRADVPPSIRATDEFRVLCPSTAACMRKFLSEKG